MAQSIFIAHTNKLKNVADKIGSRIFFNSMVQIDDSVISTSELLKMASMSTTEFFYVINSDRDIVFTNFNFAFKPPEWDKNFVHIWNNSTQVRLYCKDHVMNSPELYDDTMLSMGNIKLKILNDTIFKEPHADIVFISYDENNANINYDALLQRFPSALRSHGVKGIIEAHRAAAKLSTTDMVYIVDADAEIVPTFDFSYRPNGYDSDSVHVWYSKNPINDLVYGYGGVKLFPRKLLLNYSGRAIDFTTTISNHFKVMHEISNVSKFNTDPFSAWRSGFRECAKLASKLIPNQNDIETTERLEIWRTKGADREFGKFAILGANDGYNFGISNKEKPEVLGLINDYKWLSKKFQG